jgi:hypothetical protein
MLAGLSSVDEASSAATISLLSRNRGVSSSSRLGLQDNKSPTQVIDCLTAVFQCSLTVNSILVMVESLTEYQLALK